jgi:threonine dehydratase
MAKVSTTYFPKLEDIKAAALRLQDILQPTPLELHKNASEDYQAEIYFKREDLQLVRSYKIRGAYNKIASLSKEEAAAGVVCASAGNHAQGVAYACQLLKIKGYIFMPKTTPQQKVEQVRFFGRNLVEIILQGDNFDQALASAKAFCQSQKQSFIPPFDDPKIIEGQATIALEILNQLQNIDYLLLPVGGGGLAAGLSSVFKLLSPKTKVIAVEPEGAASLSHALSLGKNEALSTIDTFVDGAAVRQIGALNFPICQQNIDRVLTVHPGAISATMLELYNRDAIVVEPAAALSVAALKQLKAELKGKTVVCIISGSNNDIARMEEVRERALLYEGLKHYFIIQFPQRAGALKEFVAEILGPKDDIVHFEYSKKTNRAAGPALIGIQLDQAEDLNPLLLKLEEKAFEYTYLNQKPSLYSMLV